MWTVRSQALLLVTLVLTTISGCRRLPRAFRPKSHNAKVTARPLPPLTGLQRFESLQLLSFESATVSVPLGARVPRPVVVALHGQLDSVSVDCNAWSTITDYSYFVLCPALRNKPTANQPATDCSDWGCAAAELKEALVALRKRYGAYVAPKEVMLVGFGRGAALAVPIAQQDPSVFSRLWLVDGGLDIWSSTLSATYGERGGKLLAIACTYSGCQPDAQRVLASAHAVGLRAVDFRSMNGTGLFTPSLTNSLKATWQSVRPTQQPWSVPKYSPVQPARNGVRVSTAR